MATPTELAAQILSAHLSKTEMSKDEMFAELTELHNTLTALERGEVPTAADEGTESPSISRKKAFGKDKIFCMICGKGFKTLSRHLRTAHDTTPKEYRVQFEIPTSQSLASRNYSESRRQMAVDRGLADNLAKARANKKKK
ncbi:MucR family transcriptional regulator [Geopsychrobacter electrodiphilus]|uniref:MucR family transcriptional regulator n=1 Tax=Geopsychrobacter electrodiphilus TaxID=225196 RepID=UPI0003787B00|nr:MucR family transcriptional regulator [Geopsychrobacter electrodiphilus]